MKFDVVVGNPPYQENNENRNRDDSIYPYFYELSEKIGDIYSLISPARFLFNIGSTSKEWNKKMLNDEHLKVIHYEQNSEVLFPNTDIKGGVVIILRNKNIYYEKIEEFFIFEILKDIYIKVKTYNDTYKESFSKLMYVQTKFNIDEIIRDYPELREKFITLRKGKEIRENRVISSSFSTLRVLFSTEEFKDSVKIFGIDSNKRQYRNINKNYIEKDRNFMGYKVLVPAANGSGALGEVLSTPLIGEPLIGHTQTFISLGNFDNEYEAISLLKYIKTKFARAMLGIKKITQNNKTPETWSRVPLQDFTQDSDIDWSKSIPEIDQQLYKKYGLSEEEINFIETKVKAME